MTVTDILVMLAFVLTIASAVGKAPLWIPVFLLALVALLMVFPL